MDKLHLDQHISHQFNKELEDIRSKVLTMGGLVERQVTDGLIALLEGDNDLASQVAQNDYEINRLEVEIDEECTQVLARRQPAASDLRLIVTVIKAITDLERIGDEAEKLGRFSRELTSNSSEIPSYRKELRHLGELVKSMLQDALDAFARLDVEAALRIAERDEDVNREYETLERLLATHLVEDPRQVSKLFKITWCARALERIGDHSVNICEYVVYLVKGRDIRHISFDQIRSELLNKQDHA
jgi:phosphate transport system protein